MACEMGIMKRDFAPFKNIMFSVVYEAFKRLYPGKSCSCYWDVIEGDDGERRYGATAFMDGEAVVFVDVGLSVVNAVEIFAHELAHVAVGDIEGHGEAWENAFEAIYNKYEEVSDEMFPDLIKVNPKDGGE